MWSFSACVFYKSKVAILTIFCYCLVLAVSETHILRFQHSLITHFNNLPHLQASCWYWECLTSDCLGQGCISVLHGMCKVRTAKNTHFNCLPFRLPGIVNRFSFCKKIFYVLERETFIPPQNVYLYFGHFNVVNEKVQLYTSKDLQSVCMPGVDAF